jgi:Domain of unknown function (DUF1735)
MKYNKYLKLFSILSIFTFVLMSCEQDVASDNPLADNLVGLVDLPATITMPEGESRTVEGKVYASKASNTDRVLELEVITSSSHNVAANNPNAVPLTNLPSSSYSVPATVTIPAGETEATFPITISSDDLDYAGKRVVIGIKAQEGLNIASTYMGSFGNANYEVMSKRLIVTAKRVCLLNPLRIQIATDRYGSETTWELYDGELNVIASGGPYTDQGASGVYLKPNIDLCLTSGSYTFVVYDQYSDGMDSGFGAGYYRLVNMNSDFTVEGVEIAKNGTFGANDVVEFTLP